MVECQQQLKNLFTFHVPFSVAIALFEMRYNSDIVMTDAMTLARTLGRFRRDERAGKRS